MVLMLHGADDRKKDAVYRTILDCFLSGQYRFGDSVSVRALSESIGVSRQPVMAAFNRLSLEGFVTVTAQVGCQVVTPSATEISDFFLLFSRYEGLMAELAAKRCTDRDVRAMRVANAAITMLSAADDPSGTEYRELNRTFHSAVHEGSHSQRPFAVGLDDVRLPHRADLRVHAVPPGRRGRTRFHYLGNRGS